MVSNRSMPHRNAVSVLPEPVGARISVWSPAAMAGQPSSWALVGAGNDDENQARTGSENRSSEAIGPAYGGLLTARRGYCSMPHSRAMASNSARRSAGRSSTTRD